MLHNCVLSSTFSHGDGGLGLRGWGGDVNVADVVDATQAPTWLSPRLMEISYIATSKPSKIIQAHGHSSDFNAFATIFQRENL